MRAGETALLRRDEAGAVHAITKLPDPSELRVEQLLTSEFFGLFSTVDPEMEAIWRQYYRLLHREDPTPAEREKRDALKVVLREKRHLGDSLHDELMYEVIDTLLARRAHATTPVARGALRAETVRKVLASWDEEGL
ncbi:MAG: hypothetical protein GY913_03050 [Proteobacteria bacterium]|nr:hypothetical protein [Pseudomonadota bacterium]MCP4915877.1 hypothetical protein [Pseudomonadota bacterium]